MPHFLDCCGGSGLPTSPPTACCDSTPVSMRRHAEGSSTDDAMNSHFISFVQIDGQLYELDGRTWDDKGTAFPVCHGPTTDETFVSDAAKVIREDFMARDPENMNFNVTALCKLE